MSALLEGRRIVVTGGLGGIGKVAVRTLINYGARVVVVDRASTRGWEQEQADLPADLVRYHQADLTRPESAAGLLDAAEAWFGTATDLCLLAGVVDSGGLLDQDAESMASTYEVNVLGAVHPAREAARRWIDRGSAGNLVFVSSWVQDVPWPGIAPYAASKAAMRSFARSFAREFATASIRANVLAPGIVDVGMAKLQWETEPDYRARAELAVPVGYLQPPESVADALVFLCSPLSSYMTGGTLLVDGGASLYPLQPDERRAHPDAR
jgi:NAD(P)-dependent dehydrogenase (short-subunit alcohol dehydrogenase family)